MTSASKQKILGIVCVICALLMVICIARMIPYGLAGEIGKAKPLIFVMGAAFVVSLPSAIGYYYYRGVTETNDKDLERMRIETEMLAHVGEKKPKAQSGATQFNKR